MKEITLTREELTELLQVMQEHKAIAKTGEISEFTWTFSFGEYTIKQLPLDDFFNFVTKDDEVVLFNIIDKEGKLVFDDEFIFTFAFCQSGVIKAVTKNGEVISIDNIISK